MNKSARHFIELLQSMVEKELRVRYKNTVFGFLWLVINPLLQMLVIGFVFTMFVKEPVKHYYLYLFTGLLMWNFFSLSLSKTTPSIVFERLLIKKAAFPRSIVPLSIVVSNFINFLVALLLLIVPVAFLGTMSWQTVPYALAAIALLMVLTVGLSLLFSALNVRYRDINFLVQALLIVWFYATPVVYSLEQLPQSMHGLWMLNPLAAPVLLMQSALVGSVTPSTTLLAANIILTIACAGTGLYIFSVMGKDFDDWL